MRGLPTSDPMHVSARVAPVGEAFRQVRNMQGDEVFFSLYNTGGVSDHHPRLQDIFHVHCPLSLKTGEHNENPEAMIFHPSLAGSYLSGLLHFLALFPQNSVLGITETMGLDDATAGLLQVSCYQRIVQNIFIGDTPRRYFILLFLKQEAAEETWALGLPWDFPVGEDCNLCMCHCT